MLLAVAFGMAGTMTREDHALLYLGAATSGMVLPSVTRIRPRIRPVLTPLAGVAIVMVLAGGMHAVRGELQMVPINVLLGGLAVFVAWGRFKKAPIEPRR